MGRLFATISGYLRLLTRKDTPWSAKLILAGALIYLLSPYDLIPDWLLGLGIVDDFAVVSFLVWLVLRLIGTKTDPVE